MKKRFGLTALVFVFLSMSLVHEKSIIDQLIKMGVEKPDLKIKG